MYCFRISTLVFSSPRFTGSMSPERKKRPIRSLGRFRHSLPVQLNHIRRSIVDTLRAINATQQSGSDVPVFAAFSDNCNRLFVVARQHTNLKRPTFRLKRNPIANTELQHLGVSPHVPQEFQPFDNPIVKINQFSFGKPVNVDSHDSSNSNDVAVEVLIGKQPQHLVSSRPSRLLVRRQRSHLINQLVFQIRGHDLSPVSRKRIPKKY